MKNTCKTYSPLNEFACRAMAFAGSLFIFAGIPAFAASPIVFNATESAAPGDVIYVQGDNFIGSGTSSTVYFYLVSGTEPSLNAPPSGATVLTPLTSSSNALTVRLPANDPLGLYAVWVGSSSGTSPATFINRARAMSFEYSAISPGYPFRIFGRNLSLTGATPIVSFVSGTSSYTATISGSYPNDTNILQVNAPTTLPTSGTYTVKVSNGYGHVAAGTYDVTPSEETIQARTGGTGATNDPFGLGVPWGYDFVAIHNTMLNVTGSNSLTGHNYGADPTGVNDSTAAIQLAISDAGSATFYPNGATVYLPSGTYSINKGTNLTAFTIPAKVVLMGSGTAATTINDNSPAINGYSFFVSITTALHRDVESGDFAGVQGFTYNQKMTVSATTSPPSIRNFSDPSSEMFFDHINANFAHAVFYPSGTSSGPISAIQYGGFVPQGGSLTNVLVQDCTMNGLRFGNANYYSYGFTYGKNYIFRGNNWSDYFARLEFDYIDNLIVEGNTFTRSGIFPPHDYGGNTTCGGADGVGSDIVMIDNTFNTDGTQLSYYNDGESILNQALPILSSPSNNIETGTESSATTNTLTPSGTSGSNSYVGEVLYVTSGSSTGEWGEITANNGTKFTVSPSWSVIPPAGSQFQVIPANTYHWGIVTSSGSNTLQDTTQNWPTNFMTGTTNGINVVAIVNGSAMGQLYNIASNNSNTLTISGTWIEPPPAGATYVVTSSGANRWLVKGNSLNGLPRGIVFYCGSHDSVVADNTLENTGETIYLRGDQRPTLSGASYDRFSPTWKDLVNDNVLVHTTGSFNYQVCYADSVFATTGSGTVGGQGLSIIGTESLGLEFRRNVQESILVNGTNQEDGATGEFEGYDNDIGWSVSLGTFTDKLPGKLGTLFDDNVSVDTVHPYRLTTGDYQTTIWNAAPYYPTTSGALIIDGTLNGAGHASTNTITGTDGYACFFDANFTGSGTSTGLGSTGTNVVDVGAGGAVTAGSGQNFAGISSGTIFVTGTGGSGDYLTTTTGTTGNGAYVTITPITPRKSWGRIYDSRNGLWLVNGGFDFFWRPASTPIANSMRAIDISNSKLRLTFHTGGTNSLQHEIITTGTGGGGLTITGTYAPGFVAGQIYHVGVTYSTNISTLKTTEKIFAVSGTGAITTSSTANLIATGTFTLNPAVVNDDTGFLGGASWQFCKSYGDGAGPHINDFDGFRMYYTDSGTLPPLVTPIP